MMFKFLLMQTASRAIGICAEFGGEVFKQHLQGSSTSISAFVLWELVGTHSNCFADGLFSLAAIFNEPGQLVLEKIMVKEVAISAYGKLCSFLTEDTSIYKVRLCELFTFFLFTANVNDDICMHYAACEALAHAFAINV